MNVESKAYAEWIFKMLSESSVSICGVVRHLSVGSVSPHKVLCKHGCALMDILFPVCRFDSSCTLNVLLTQGLEQCWRFIIIKGTLKLTWAGGCDTPSQYIGCSQYLALSEPPSERPRTLHWLSNDLCFLSTESVQVWFCLEVY